MFMSACAKFFFKVVSHTQTRALHCPRRMVVGLFLWRYQLELGTTGKFQVLQPTHLL
jgi:hypothetical protein